MKRRMIAAVLVLLALSMMAACVNVPGLGLVSVFNMDRIEEKIEEQERQQIEAEMEQRRQRQQAEQRQWEERQRQEAARRAREVAERQARAEQQRQAEAERRAQAEAARQEEAERRAQAEAVRQVQGYISLYSAYAGTVLVNGEETQFTAEAGKDVNITIENAVGKEHTIAVRDSGGTVRPAVAAVNIASNNSRYSAFILDPNPPPNSGDDFEITQNAQGGITITRYTGTRRQVVIPQTIEGIRVTEIGGGAFYQKQLISVTIGNSITTIGYNAFAHNNLTSVTIPNSVITIGQQAFNQNQLTSVTIPNSVTEIGNYAFNQNKLTSVTIPNSVGIIWDGAFRDNQLTSVTIPNIIIIGDSAFSSNQLASITIGFVESMGRDVFTNNPITSITIPANSRASGSFPNNFSTFYESQSRRAGTYTWSGRVWTVR